MKQPDADRPGSAIAPPRNPAQSRTHGRPGRGGEDEDTTERRDPLPEGWDDPTSWPGDPEPEPLRIPGLAWTEEAAQKASQTREEPAAAGKDQASAERREATNGREEAAQKDDLESLKRQFSTIFGAPAEEGPGARGAGRSGEEEAPSEERGDKAGSRVGAGTRTGGNPCKTETSVGQEEDAQEDGTTRSDTGSREAESPAPLGRKVCHHSKAEETDNPGLYPAKPGLDAADGDAESVHEREATVHERETTPAETPETAFEDAARLLEFVRDRKPDVPYLEVPEELREMLREWRPILGEVEGLMALVQLIHFARCRDEHGVVTSYKPVLKSFGLSERTAYRHGAGQKKLLDLYRWKVDPEMAYHGYSPDRNLARKVYTTGLPEEIEEMIRRVKLCPADFSDSRWVYLVNGKSAHRRNHQKTIHEERMDEADNYDPTIEAPESAKVIQHYLNHVLDQSRFAHGGYGIVATKVDEAIEYVKELKGQPPFDSEAKVDTALRTLYWMRHYPTPVYLPSDGSPRLKADHYNQFMNLASEIRPAFYTDRDVELDGAKMHMSSFPVIARREGLAAPTVERYLKASLDGEDLWSDLAGYFDEKKLPDPKARRKAAKISYCTVYGADEGETFFNIKREYANRTGAPLATDDAVRGILKHPMIAEIFEVREQLFEIIEEQGYLEDAYGRKIRPEDFPHKAEEKRVRSVLAYVAASYEQRLVAELFEEATDEMEWAAEKESRDPRFWIWLYQADGVTIRVGRKQNPDTIIERLQERFDEKAKELGLITRLEVAWRHDDA